jgi:hypothetical protein
LARNLDFSFKSYGKESLYKYCINVDDGRIMRSWRSCLFISVGKLGIQNMFVKMPYNVLQMKYCKLTFITIEKMFHKWNDLNSILKIKCDFITFYKWNGSARCSRVMGLYSSNYRRFFVCRAINWEPLGQFTSNFALLLELIILRSVYFKRRYRLIKIKPKCSSYFIIFQVNTLQIL